MQAAGIMYVTGDDDSVLLLRRTAEGDLAGSWSIPGGKLEDGEDEETAARREIEEEIGRDASKDDLIPWTRTLRDGVDYQTYLCRISEPFVPTLNDEHDDYRWVPVHELVVPQGYSAGSKKDSQEITERVEQVARKPIFTMNSDGSLDFYGRA